jgi:hypothetical protein
VCSVSSLAANSAAMFALFASCGVAALFVEQRASGVYCAQRTVN